MKGTNNMLYRVSGFSRTDQKKRFDVVIEMVRAPADCDHQFQLIATKRSD